MTKPVHLALAIALVLASIPTASTVLAPAGVGGDLPDPLPTARASHSDPTSQIVDAVEETRDTAETIAGEGGGNGTDITEDWEEGVGNASGDTWDMIWYDVLDPLDDLVFDVAGHTLNATWALLGAAWDDAFEEAGNAEDAIFNYGGAIQDSIFAIAGNLQDLAFQTVGTLQDLTFHTADAVQDTTWSQLGRLNDRSWATLGGLQDAAFHAAGNLLDDAYAGLGDAFAAASNGPYALWAFLSRTLADGGGVPAGAAQGGADSSSAPSMRPWVGHPGCGDGELAVGLKSDTGQFETLCVGPPFTGSPRNPCSTIHDNVVDEGRIHAAVYADVSGSQATLSVHNCVGSRLSAVRVVAEGAAFEYQYLEEDGSRGIHPSKITARIRGESSGDPLDLFRSLMGDTTWFDTVLNLEWATDGSASATTRYFVIPNAGSTGDYAAFELGQILAAEAANTGDWDAPESFHIVAGYDSDATDSTAYVDVEEMISTNIAVAVDSPVDPFVLHPVQTDTVLEIEWETWQDHIRLEGDTEFPTPAKAALKVGDTSIELRQVPDIKGLTVATSAGSSGGFPGACDPWNSLFDGTPALCVGGTLQDPGTAWSGAEIRIADQDIRLTQIQAGDVLFATGPCGDFKLETPSDGANFHLGDVAGLRSATVRNIKSVEFHPGSSFSEAFLDARFYDNEDHTVNIERTSDGGGGSGPPIGEGCSSGGGGGETGDFTLSTWGLKRIKKTSSGPSLNNLAIHARWFPGVSVPDGNSRLHVDAHFEELGDVTITGKNVRQASIAVDTASDPHYFHLTNYVSDGANADTWFDIYAPDLPGNAQGIRMEGEDDGDLKGVFNWNNWWDTTKSFDPHDHVYYELPSKYWPWAQDVTIHWEGCDSISHPSCQPF